MTAMERNEEKRPGSAPQGLGSPGASRRRWRAGSALFQAGQQPPSVHRVLCGHVRLSLLTVEGDEQILGVRGPGDWLGLDGVADGRHVCDAVALDDVETVSLGPEAWRQARLDEGGLPDRAHRALADELVRLQDTADMLCRMDAAGRVARFVADSLPPAARDGEAVRLPLSRMELANHLGMRLEAVSRAMTALSQAGLVRVPHPGSRNVQVPDTAVLQAYVQGHRRLPRRLQEVPGPAVVRAAPRRSGGGLAAPPQKESR